MSDGLTWVEVCATGDIDRDDVLRFDHGGATYAIFHTPSGFYATAGLCTHEFAYLSDGYVEGEIVECPKHNGRFHIPTGKVKSSPAQVALQTFPVRVVDGKVLIGLPPG